MIGSPASQGSNPFVCNICQKTYGRIDHLARHFRSHTNEKPFRCRECSKTFARADLLKRHASLHSVTEASGKKRKIRASQACTACASVKVKCDQDKPCRRCTSKGLECHVDLNVHLSGSRSDEQTSPPDRFTDHSDGLYPSPHPISSRNIAHDSQESPAKMRMPSRPVADSATPIVGESSLTGFLSNVVHAAVPGHFQSSTHHTTWNGQIAPRDLMDFNQDLSIDFNDLDEVLSGSWDDWLDPALITSFDGSAPKSTSDVSTPSIDESIHMSSAAYSRSAWRWVPDHGKGNEDQKLTSVLADSTDPHHSHCPERQSLTSPLTSEDRDRMVALLLSACEKPNYQRIVSSFPEVNILDIFLNDYLLHLEHALDSWLHIPTFQPSEALPELLTVLIAGGATLGKAGQTQKLGYALQDKARVAIHESWDADVRNTRNLQSLQAFAILLEIGIWSGNKHTMEMAEASIYPLTTMIRRQGGFRRSRGNASGPSAEDSPAVLEEKWHAWIEAESFKRLAYHLFIFCVQVSIAFQTPPLLSYAEITLELPAPQSVWRATTPEEWKTQYLAHEMEQPLPAFVSTMCDAQIMGAVRERIDLHLTLYLVLLSHWLLAWEYSQLSSANKAQAATQVQWAGTMLASSKSHELRRLLDTFYVAIEEWRCFVPKEVHMTSQLLRMSLCVTFEDLQLVAGREGEDEARRVLPSLKQWFRSSECREGLCHAGQVLRAARRPSGSPAASRYTPPDTPWIRDFHAVALYHAGLTFWAYGLLARTIALDRQAGSPGHEDVPPAIDYEGPIIRVDGDDEELPEIDRHGFIGLNKGRAVISATSPFVRGPLTTDQTTTIPSSCRTEALRASRGPNTAVVTTQTKTVPLDDPKAAMDVIIRTLTSDSQPMWSSSREATLHARQRPAMVENLVQLLRDLGQAASVV